jgi:hypothetical protein
LILLFGSSNGSTQRQTCRPKTSSGFISTWATYGSPGRTIEKDCRGGLFTEMPGKETLSPPARAQPCSSTWSVRPSARPNGI